jgi:hypothetical protein
VEFYISHAQLLPPFSSSDFTSQQDPIKFIKHHPQLNQTSHLGHQATLTQLPHLFKSQITQRTSTISHPFKFLSNNPHRKSPCLPSWRKFLTPSTTLPPLLATPPFPTSLQTLPPATRMLLTMMQSWPAPQKAADSTSETSRTRRPRGS